MNEVLARIAAALAEVDAAPLPEERWWERGAGRWTPPPTPLTFTWVEAARAMTVHAGALREALVAVGRACQDLDAATTTLTPDLPALPQPFGRSGRLGQVSPHGPPARRR